MPAIKYKVNLTEAEKLNLEALLHKGKSAARSQTRARILLKAASGCQDKAIIEALNVSPSMVAKTRQRCVEEGPEAALKDPPRPGIAPKLTDRQQRIPDKESLCHEVQANVQTRIRRLCPSIGALRPNTRGENWPAFIRVFQHD